MYKAQGNICTTSYLKMSYDKYKWYKNGTVSHKMTNQVLLTYFFILDLSSFINLALRINYKCLLLAAFLLQDHETSSYNIYEFILEKNHEVVSTLTNINTGFHTVVSCQFGNSVLEVCCKCRKLWVPLFCSINIVYYVLLLIHMVFLYKLKLPCQAI